MIETMRTRLRERGEGGGEKERERAVCVDAGESDHTG